MLIGAATVVVFPQTVPLILDFLFETFKNILGTTSPQPGLSLARALLRQNLLASLYDLVFGAVFGILPVFSIFGNFFIIGFLGGISLFPHLLPEPSNLSFGVYLLAILPHGIFEIPALLLAAAFGLRLGWQWLLPSSRGRRKQVFKQGLLDNAKILVLILVLLIIAAAVESFVTSRLV